MRWRRAIAGGIALAFACAACGLGVTGQLGDGEDGGPGGPIEPGPSTPANDGAVSNPDDDGGTNPPIDSGMPCETDACALPDVGDAGPAAPAVAFAFFGDRASPCPSGFDTIDVIEKPTPGAGACACGACTKGASNCNSGGIPTFYDNGNGTCGTSGAEHVANDGQCRNQSGQFGSNASVGATTAVPATCSVAASTSSKAAVTVTSERICKLQSSTCASALCAAPPGAMKLCTVTDGEAACPASLPTRHLVADDFTMTCAACSCSVTATCTGTLSFYPAANCNGAPKSLMTGVCTSTSSASFQSTKWAGTVVTDTCNLSDAPAPTIALSGTKTLCCN